MGKKESKYKIIFEDETSSEIREKISKSKEIKEFLRELIDEFDLSNDDSDYYI